MSKIDKKLEQIQLQHQISKRLMDDNGASCHFDYHVNLLSDYETIKLNLLTYNQRHNEYMLLHSVKGTSSIDCLKKALTYLERTSEQAADHSYTINWKKKGDAKDHTSYFMASDEEEATEKFLHEKNPDDYVFTITENPIS